MASSLYIQYYADGTSRRIKRSVAQGRRPSGLSHSRLVRLYQNDEPRLLALSEKLGYYWNENQFIRDAVKEKLDNSVYIESLNP